MKKGKEKKRAVALKYRPMADSAPKVTAMGKGEVAERIIAIAREHDIHIHDDPDLVEVLSQLDLNEEIPPCAYAVVAELLSFVYGVNRGKSPQAGGSA